MTRGKNPFGGQNPFKGTPFEDMIPDGQFFGGETDNFGWRMPERDGVGSGVIIDRSGIVLTNNHVVQGADEVTVVLADGREFKGTDIKTDPQDRSGRRAASRGEGLARRQTRQLGRDGNRRLGAGDRLPIRAGPTVSAGIISGKGRELGERNHASFLQTDAAINPGNSGGPLVNIDGEVDRHQYGDRHQQRRIPGHRFLDPDQHRQVGHLAVDGERDASRAAIWAMGLEEISSDLARKLGVHSNEGVLVAEVMPNTPAAAAGVKEGDIVTAFAGTAVHSPPDLRDLVETGRGRIEANAVVDREGKH